MTDRALAAALFSRWPRLFLSCNLETSQQTLSFYNHRGPIRPILGALAWNPPSERFVSRRRILVYGAQPDCMLPRKWCAARAAGALVIPRGAVKAGRSKLHVWWPAHHCERILSFVPYGSIYLLMLLPFLSSGVVLFLSTFSWRITPGRLDRPKPWFTARYMSGELSLDWTGCYLGQAFQTGLIILLSIGSIL